MTPLVFQITGTTSLVDRCKTGQMTVLSTSVLAFALESAKPRGTSDDEFSHSNGASSDAPSGMHLSSLNLFRDNNMLLFSAGAVALMLTFYTTTTTAGPISFDLDLHTRAFTSASTSLTGPLSQPINSTGSLTPLSNNLGPAVAGARSK